MERREPGVVQQSAEVTPNGARILSIELQQDIEQEGITVGGREFTAEEMSHMRAEILLMQQELDKEKLNPYHNAEHAAEVADRLELLIQKIPLLVGWRADVLRVAALFHDYGHSGKTIREADDGLTNEEFAAKQADSYAKKSGFSVFQRILLQGEIIGTTFGNPEVSPQTHEEETLAIADIAGFSKSWDEWVEESAAVLAETDLQQRPSSIDEWLRGRESFLNFANKRMTAEARVLWGTDLDLQQQTVAALLANPNHVRRRFVEELIGPLLQKH